MSLKTLVNLRGMLTEEKKYKRANVLLQQIESITNFDEKVVVTPSVLNNFIKKCHVISTKQGFYEVIVPHPLRGSNVWISFWGKHLYIVVTRVDIPRGRWGRHAIHLSIKIVRQ